MSFLFDLYISHIEEEDSREYEAYYHIGTFRTKEDADVAKKTVMSNGGLFSEPNCNSSIQNVEVIGGTGNIDCVYRFWGQNFDPSLEGDRIDSPYYTDKPTAIQEFINAKKNTPRQRWGMDTYKIGKYNWR